MIEPIWVLREVVLMLHDQSLSQFGGSVGIREEGLLDSALGKPHNLFAYGNPSIFDLAASYGFGLIKNHPFLDGNKRTGFIVATLFLEINGYLFAADEVDSTLKTLALAAGEISESDYSQWLQKGSKKR
jgi:death on curing protein